VKLLVAVLFVPEDKLGDTMPDRKQFQNVTAPDPELMRLLEATRDKQVTEEELHEQRISFAFGNALGSDQITKESVRLASKNIKLLG
jgi:hypothetical protein